MPGEKLFTNGVVTLHYLVNKNITMEIYYQPEDMTVFGIQVKTFPNGIKEAFDSLMSTFGNYRSCYGISWLDENDSVQYYAMVPEAFEREANKYHYEKLIIKKGEYRTETIYNWLSKLDSIKDVFHGLVPNNRPNKNHPCVEWYKTDDEMLCMIRV
jgi:hypothetical protein